MGYLKTLFLCGRGVRHGFFGRRGGVSTGIYSSLNCGLGTQDDRANVTENRARVLAKIGGTHLLTLYQDHTPDAVLVTSPWNMGEGAKADAMVTDIPGLALGILTADCAPVLFSGRRKDGAPVIGAAHAGWRGAVGGVLENTVLRMRELGAMDIRAMIGPCIGPKSYEVSAGFEVPFLAQDTANARFFRKGRFDLPGYVRARLALAGVVAKWCGKDTYIKDSDYFSYRRKTHKGETDYGRQISVISIRSKG